MLSVLGALTCLVRTQAKVALMTAAGRAFGLRPAIAALSLVKLHADLKSLSIKGIYLILLVPRAFVLAGVFLLGLLLLGLGALGILPLGGRPLWSRLGR